MIALLKKNISLITVTSIVWRAPIHRGVEGRGRHHMNEGCECSTLFCSFLVEGRTAALQGAGLGPVMAGFFMHR